ncbi:MAG: 50S ribosomal protein L20 [Candidatus Dependentiae bacterium]|nr:50S ribosomal protein L20 [Candidatus Dependentiae bacterium]
MSRIKSGKVTRQRHKRLLKQTKGFFGQRKNIFRRAKETLMRALAYAFKGRKLKKRNMRALFITRINAAVRPLGFSYSAFIPALKKANIQLNRKMLSQLAIFEPTVFQKVVETARS